MSTIYCTGESTPLLLTRFSDVKKKEHPVMKMLKGLSPIDSSFKHERLWWKILIIIKVLYNVASVCVCVCVCVRVRVCV